MHDKVILVLEDERPLAEAIRIKLEKYSFSVVVARTVEQALGYMSDLPVISAIWLDHYLLGKETGLDFLNKIKNDGSVWRSIPVFVVSNTASEDKVKSYLELGVEKYFVKAEVRLDDVIAEIKSKVS